ncbi:AraC family transcriptional regulator [Brevundimonas sp. 2R-24]|uniref:AraC family transcriptional regulator n=1 Tax=Peiella sedimenti TaxID=3061083 RepID=A0ABT8SKY0_9CAUL|nr:AraC family transcriptional regulator [Caulobacteraceae bacterium XZ-24]
MVDRFVHVKGAAPGGWVAPSDGHVVLSEVADTVLPLAPRGLSVKLCLQGEEHYDFGGQKLVLRSGHMMVVQGETPGVATLPRSTPSLGMCIYLPPDQVDESLFPRIGSRAYVTAAGGSRLGRLALRTAARLHQRPELGPHAAPRLLAATLASLPQLQSETLQRFEALDCSKASTRRELLRRLELARVHLHENVDRLVSLSELSQLVNVSAFHLARSFSAAYGMPPAAYHADIRMKAARIRLLREGRRPSQVAHDLGYSDLRAFSRAFKRAVGSPPSLYVRGAA